MQNMCICYGTQGQDHRERGQDRRRVRLHDLEASAGEDAEEDQRAWVNKSRYLQGSEAEVEEETRSAPASCALTEQGGRLGQSR